MRYSTSFRAGASAARVSSLVVCEPARFASSLSSHHRVLLVDDDPATLEMWALLLADAGVHVEAVPGADACLRVADERVFDLIVIDLKLGPESGLDVMRRLRDRGHATAFVLVTGHASTAVTVDAMRLGAKTVLEKPLIGDDFVAPILRELQLLDAAVATSAPAGALSVAHRWAGYVLRAAEAEDDPRTLADWARAAGVSRSALIEACARLDINPRDARDLARVLRLVRRTSEPWNPEAALNVADRRTLRSLLIRAGLADAPRGVRPAPQRLLAMQRFVPQTNAGLAALRLIVG